MSAVAGVAAMEFQTASIFGMAPIEVFAMIVVAVLLVALLVSRRKL